VKRRLFVASSMAAALAGCDGVTNALAGNAGVRRVVDAAALLDAGVIGTHGRAQLYAASQITRDFPTNGNPTPTDMTYAALEAHRFATYRLRVEGLVDRPHEFALPALRRMANVDEITRHDCVEGWSVVGRWQGVRLATLLAAVGVKPEARYVVFYSFDSDSQGTPFYGSIGIHEAAAPQTQLATSFNGQPTPAAYGGPVRLRIPTQLGYKSTKWVHRIALVDSYKKIYGGHGGYWEDNGYAWYAGI